MLVSVPLFSSLISAAAFSPPSPPRAVILRAPQTLSSPFVPNNITNTSTTPSNVLRIQCDGSRYGRDLNPHSCRDVFNFLPQSDEQETFSERHTGRLNDVPLPIRVISDDGRCFMQPLLLRGAVTGHASSTQMGQAAYIIFERCVLEKGVGGIAADIGAFEFPFNSTVLRISSCRISKQCFWT